MTNTTAACEKTNAQEERHHYSWLEDYLERLENREAFRAFQDCQGSTPEYYALVASLAA